ncbi:MAG: hypothetical protein EOO15_07535 [Chitinophagaceae bacterium]|nr:MAG: hypothetical protein EOO15_07535 [Chitinophagaceae bacterium]
MLTICVSRLAGYAFILLPKGFKFAPVKKLFLSASLLALLGIAILSGPGCANIVPPQGGPRDSLPPQLVKASPPDSSVNFQGRNIELTFNEYIDLQETRANLTVSPMYEIQPEISAKLRTLTIRIKDSLEANTTYTFNFGNAIRDITENNVLRGFSYSFSTGPALDSLRLGGSVILAESGAIDTTILVELYRNLTDSAVQKQGPRYITHLDAQGRFEFRNLPAGTFAVYALEDKNNRRYLAKNQLFAFLDSTVTTGRPGAPVQLYAYREVPLTAPGAGPGGTRATAQPAADRRLKYTAPTTPQALQTDYRITFDNKVQRFDSTKVRLIRDSINTAPFNLRLDSTSKVLSLNTKWEPGSTYTLYLDKDFATDTSGRSQLRTDTITFLARRMEDYGKLLLRFRNVQAASNPVLQFVQGGVVIFSAPISSGTLTRDLFQPGDYDLRVLFDRNGNGQWDLGSFFEGRKQPELVRPVERKLTVKADIENEIEIALPDPPGK